MFIVNYAAISTQTTLQQQVCWDEDYRFGFNGMEKDNEAKGQGNSLDFGARIYDSRLGRWLSVDPSFKMYTGISPFHFATNNPVNYLDANGRWARDQNGNIIVVMEKTQGTFTIGGERRDAYGNGLGIYDAFEVKGTYGYVLSNNGEKVQVFVPSSNQVIHYVMDASGQVIEQTDVTMACTGERNCTTNALFPEISSLIISSDQITDDILKAEGYVPASEIEKNVQDLANGGDPAATGFDVEDITKKSDIVAYGSSGNYEHFEVYTSDHLVNTKGGVQKDPYLALPGKNVNFSNPQAWINTNVGGWQDPTTTIAGSTGKTSSGLVEASSAEFDQIQVELMVK
ncbi:MAG: RHS repeat-associated core domain-containing protein [Bacteroidia bacterium]